MEEKRLTLDVDGIIHSLELNLKGKRKGRGKTERQGTNNHFSHFPDCECSVNSCLTLLWSYLLAMIDQIPSQAKSQNEPFLVLIAFVEYFVKAIRDLHLNP